MNTTQRKLDPVVSFSRPVPPDVNLDVLPLRLSDGYETSVYVCRGNISSIVANVLSSRISGGSALPVLQVHGIQSHPGWFMGSATVMARSGRPVFQVTRRGSGANTVARGDCPSLNQLLDDVETACRFALEQTSASRLNLVGISWGGKLLAAYMALRRPTQVASLTLVAPGIRSRVDVSLLTKLRIASRVLIHPEKLFDIPLNDVELFTANEAMREYLRADGHRLHQATARFLGVSKRIDLELRRCRSKSIASPTTLLLASEDRIIHNARTLEEVQRLTGGKAAIRELPGQHSLEFESDPGAFYELLVDSLRAV